MKLRSLLILASLLVSSLPAQEEKPHILYINADDLGVMDVGYNNKKFRTPNLDALAQEGMVFTNAYAPSANCAPSRACVHSGQWSSRHGVYTVGTSERGDVRTRKLIPIKNTSHLPDGHRTLAQTLKEGGYHTIHLGKYHLGKDPLTMGFDVNIGGDGSGSPDAGGYFSPWGKGQMVSLSDQYPKGTHRMDVFVDQAIKFMKTKAEKPMFIHFSPYSVHTPIQAVPAYLDNYDPKDKFLNAKYGSMVEKFDEGVGKVLQYLNESGLREKTLIVFSSDNGGIRSIATQAPYRAGKGSYYEGGIREPFIAAWKGRIKPGSTCEIPVTTLDLFPTFLAIGGVDTPANHKLDGMNITPLFQKDGSLAKRTLFWHFPIYLQAYSPATDDARDPLFRTRPGSALRHEKWKLHHYFEDDAYELYDLEKDLGERVNLASEKPKKLAELKQLLNDWRTETKSPIPTEKNPKYDPDYQPSKKGKKKKAA